MYLFRGVEYLTRHKFYCDLPLNIINDKLSDILASECKNFEATWISESEAVFSSDTSEKDMRKIFTKYNIIIKNKPDNVKHSMDKKGHQANYKLINR